VLIEQQRQRGVCRYDETSKVVTKYGNNTYDMGVQSKHELVPARAVSSRRLLLVVDTAVVVWMLPGENVTATCSKIAGVKLQSFSVMCLLMRSEDLEAWAVTCL